MVYQPNPVTRRASLVAARRFFGAGRFYFRGGYFFWPGAFFFARGAFLGRPSFFSRADFFLYGAENFSDARHVYTARKKNWTLDTYRPRSARIAARHARRHPDQHSRSPASYPDASEPYPDPPPDATYAKERPTGASGFKRRLVYSGERRGADRRSYRPAARRGVE